MFLSMVSQTASRFNRRCPLVWKNFRRLAGLWAVLALLSGEVFAEGKAASAQPGGTVDAEWLASEIKQLRDNPAPSETAQSAMLEACQRADELLQERANSLAESKKYQTALDDIPARMEALRAALNATAPENPSVSATATQTLAQIEDRIHQTDTALTTARSQLTELESRRQDRAGRQIELARQLAEGKANLQSLSKSPEVFVPGESQDAAHLRRILKSARQAALEAKLQALAAELLYSQSSVELEALQISDANLRVAAFARQLADARELLAKQRAGTIQKAILKSEEKQREVAKMPDAGWALDDLARRNIALLRMQTGKDDLSARIDGAAQELDSARNELGVLRADFERLQKRVAALEAAGGRYDEALAQLLRERLGKLPARTVSLSLGRSLRKEISDAMVQLDNLQDERMALGDPDSPGAEQTWQAGALSPKALELERELLQIQRDSLDALTAAYSSYLQTLTELQVVRSNISDVSEDFSAFINEHVLWIRSAPQWSFSNPGQRMKVFLRYWPASGLVEIPSVLASDLTSHWVVGFSGLGILFLLQYFGRRMRNHSRKLADKARTRMCLSWLVTLEELVWSFLRALRWPWLLLFAGWRLSVADATINEPFIRCVGISLMHTAASFFLLGFLRQVCMPESGLGEAHFGWRQHNVRLAWRNLAWFIPLTQPLVFILNVVKRQGFEATSGQLFLMLIMIVLVVFAHQMLRPHGGIEITGPKDKLIPANNHLHIMMYLFGLGIPLLIALGAYLGYYFSALEVAGLLGKSLWAAWLIFLTKSLILRWLVVRQRRLVVQEADKNRNAQAAGAGDRPPKAAAGIELQTIDQQTTNLLRTVFGIALVLTIFAIWSNIFPALKVLDSVKLWRVSSASQATAASSAPVFPQLSVLGGQAVKSTTRSQQAATGGNYVTLLSLLYVGLVLLVMLTASRNLPGLLKVTFLNRLKLEQGVNHAAVTLVRYAVILIGLITISNLLGLDWAKVQWIAAAFSLGIAFGLQELFANFVSGLIILLERPIRIGDIISVGDITGTVTRINIRATTITDADRRDFLIPNKNFITGNVLNWTLSDPVSRVTVPVGVAYGSDTALTGKLLVEAAAENPNIMKDPAPRAVLSGFGDNTLNFNLFIFMPKRDNYLEMLNQLTIAIDRKFREAGINIAFPQRDVHLFADKPIDVRVIGE